MTIKIIAHIYGKTLITENNKRNQVEKSILFQNELVEEDESVAGACSLYFI